MVEKIYQLSQFMHPIYYSPFIGAKLVAGAILMWIIVVFILSALLMWLWNITITSKLN